MTDDEGQMTEIRDQRSEGRKQTGPRHLLR